MPVDLSLAQATGTPVYAARLPVVHGQAPTPAAEIPTLAAVATEGVAPASAPTPAPVALAIVSIAEVPMAPTLEPTVIVVVVTATPTPTDAGLLAVLPTTPAVVVALPVTQVPAAAPISAADDQLSARLGMLAVGGVVLLVPFALALVALVAYVIARRL